MWTPTERYRVIGAPPTVTSRLFPMGLQRRSWARSIRSSSKATRRRPPTPWSSSRSWPPATERWRWGNHGPTFLENMGKTEKKLPVEIDVWIVDSTEFYWLKALKGPFLAEWGQFGRCTRHFFWNSFIVKWTCSIISLFRLRIQPQELSFDHPKIRFEAPKAAPLLANIIFFGQISQAVFVKLYGSTSFFYPTDRVVYDGFLVTSQSG